MVCKRFYRHTHIRGVVKLSIDRIQHDEAAHFPIPGSRAAAEWQVGRPDLQKQTAVMARQLLHRAVKAAETYDLAAQALHRCRARTNFKPLSPSDSNSWQELLLLRSHTTTEVVNMLQARANAFKNSLDMECYNANADADASGKLVMQPADHVMKRNHHHHELLLRRPISLGDIRPPTRLQIPRHHAGKYYPFGVRRGMIQLMSEASCGGSGTPFGEVVIISMAGGPTLSGRNT